MRREWVAVKRSDLPPSETSLRYLFSQRATTTKNRNVMTA